MPLTHSALPDCRVLNAEARIVNECGSAGFAKTDWFKSDRILCISQPPFGSNLEIMSEIVLGGSVDIQILTNSAKHSQLIRETNC